MAGCLGETTVLVRTGISHLPFPSPSAFVILTHSQTLIKRPTLKDDEESCECSISGWQYTALVDRIYGVQVSWQA